MASRFLQDRLQDRCSWDVAAAPKAKKKLPLGSSVFLYLWGTQVVIFLAHFLEYLSSVWDLHETPPRLRGRRTKLPLG
eukprot:12417402-Karenia_brevis.AAC.1